MQIHEPSSPRAERSNWTLNPGGTLNDSGGVAEARERTSPHGFTPCAPRFAAICQWAALKLSVVQSFSSLVETSQEVSLTRFVTPPRFRLTRRPAGPVRFMTR